MAAPTTEPNVDRPGSDYKSFDLDAADPALCRQACNDDQNCKAYTYVKPGVQGPKARCWLKNAVPNAVASSCCTSGVQQPTALQEKPAVTIARPMLTVTLANPVDPGPLGKGRAEGSINGKQRQDWPACNTGGPANAIYAVIELLAQTFGGATNKDYRCGSYKREIAAGVTLNPAPSSAGPTPKWGYLGGRGDVMADSLLCLAKDIGDRPGAKLTRHVQASPAGLGIAMDQTVGLKSFDAANKSASLYQMVRICAPLLGCIDTQRQDFTTTVRKSAPAFPGGQRAGDYPIKDSYSLEIAGTWASTSLSATFPPITIVTPYGQVTAKPGFTYSSNLLPVDTPFAYKGSARNLVSFPTGRGPSTPLLQDSYGRSGTPFILNVATNLPQHMGDLTPPPDWPEGMIYIPPTPDAPRVEGWISQLGFGARNGKGTSEIWNPSANAKAPTREDLNMDLARSLYERAPTANFVAEAPIRFEPPNPLNLLPEPVKSIINVDKMELWIEVNPRFAADYAAQLAFLSRESQYDECGSSGESSAPCNFAEAILLQQARVEGRADIVGTVHLYLPFNIPFVDDININESYRVDVGSGTAWDPGLAKPTINPYASAARVAMTALKPGIAYGQLVEPFSGKKSANVKQWTTQCLATPPAQTSTLPEPTHTPGKSEDLTPDLLPCNICVADKGQNEYAPFRLFQVDARVHQKPWSCAWEKQQGCYDMCNWDKKTGKFLSAVRSAIDVEGERCGQPYNEPPR